MSKKGKRLRSFILALIARHCSGEGSTPVGLCAHAWRRKKLPGSGVVDVLHHSLKVGRSPRVSALKRKVRSSHPASFQMLWWFDHVGVGMYTLAPGERNGA